jgi:hypothetical protein
MTPSAYEHLLVRAKDCLYSDTLFCRITHSPDLAYNSAYCVIYTVTVMSLIS